MQRLAVDVVPEFLQIFLTMPLDFVQGIELLR
jgi:hypothetical protein